jgi:hypothetical protein
VDKGETDRASDRICSILDAGEVMEMGRVDELVIGGGVEGAEVGSKLSKGYGLSRILTRSAYMPEKECSRRGLVCRSLRHSTKTSGDSIDSNFVAIIDEMISNLSTVNLLNRPVSSA